MHKKRIQKFQNPGGGGIQFTTPGVQNTGFSFLQQLSPYTQAIASKTFQTPKIGTGSFETDLPMINAAAVGGDPLAMKLKFDYNLRQGQQAIADAATLKNPFNGNPINIPEPSNIKSGPKKAPFSQTKAGKGVAIGSQVVGMASQFIPDQDKDMNEVDATMKQLRGAGQQALMASGNPWLMAAGAADMVIDKLGGHSDASQGLGAGTDTLNAIGSFVPGAGWLAGKTDKYSQSEAIKKSSSYTGEAAAGEKVARNAGAKLLFGRGKANEATRKQKLRDINTEGVLSDARDAFQASNYGGFSLGNQMTLAGGIKPLRVKNGAKLDKLISARELLRRASLPAVEEFKEGGKMNVIPDGQLHKNRHHMEDVGDEYKDLTTKGIPVVTEGDGGELVQQAEIERDEIIFNIDVTRKLEELMEDGSDKAALEAGKLLAIEIMENTVDNTGLMKEIS